MEKTMSVDEKIRRAEEIYYKRNLNNNTYRYKTKEKRKNNKTIRMLKQIFICIIIYIFFYIGSNKEYFLSNEFKVKIEKFTSQNEMLETGYDWVKEKYKKYFLKNEEEEKIENNNENIGGAKEENISNEISNEEEEKVQKKSQEEQDIEEIKNSISFINPIDGKISSTFGWRNPTTLSVPKYHTGLDISAPIGTKIQAATDGKIILASSEGDYGKHYKVQINDVIIIYAHCSKLYLEEGEEVKQGQSIAEVGSTRKLNTVHTYILK